MKFNKIIDPEYWHDKTNVSEHLIIFRYPYNPVKSSCFFSFLFQSTVEFYVRKIKEEKELVKKTLVNATPIFHKIRVLNKQDEYCTNIRQQS
jgi:hypothetical protein